MTSAEQPRIALVASDLSAGGAQKVMLILADRWHAQGRSVTIITTYARADDFTARSGVGVIRLGAITDDDQRRTFDQLRARYRETGELAAIGTAMANDPVVDRCINRLRDAIATAGADIVIAFGGSANFFAGLACAALPRVHLIVREGNDPDRSGAGHIYNAIRRFSFERAGTIVCNSQGGTAAIMRLLPGSKAIYLPNPVCHRPHEARCQGDPVVLSVGRLVPQKDYETLLTAFARWSRPGARLSIVGTGPLDSDLRRSARAKQIAQAVDWHGFLRDPSVQYRNATMFVLASRFEGMPMALLEAMNAGLPCIVTDGSRNVLDLVAHDVTGLVVPAGDPVAMADAMARLADDEQLRESLGAAARHFVQRFSLDATMRRWEALFQSIGIRRGAPPVVDAVFPGGLPRPADDRAPWVAGAVS